ncbi:unnamed protein product [Gemmata massiliana]|uniref:Uncharacterized protein n=1 Tax=Gemmata massiliana TaxID=1210884 RepID=A0A6P2D253_9BACT|nr:hypothetical protein [Gemmata massiliana]VTR95209.1 unnamed protein product [Gemmata massiliana]
MERLLLELLIRLEPVGDRDQALFDAVVRQKMGNAIFFGFIKPRPEFVPPDDYGMPDEKNRAIEAALGAYIKGSGTRTSRRAGHVPQAARRVPESSGPDGRAEERLRRFLRCSDPKLVNETANVALYLLIYKIDKILQIIVS